MSVSDFLSRFYAKKPTEQLIIFVIQISLDRLFPLLFPSPLLPQPSSAKPDSADHPLVVGPPLKTDANFFHHIQL